MKRDCIPALLSQMFYHYGKLVAANPAPFLVTPLLLTIALSLGFLCMNCTTNLEYLYVPINAPSKVERSKVEETFLYNEKEYYTGLRRTRLDGLVRILVQDKEGGNLFTDVHIHELLRLDSFIKEIKSDDNDTEYQYADVCARWKDACADSENTFLTYMTNKSVHDVYLTYPVHIDGYDPHFWAIQLGGIKVNSDDYINHVEAILLHYTVRFDVGNDIVQKRSIQWSRTLAQQIHNFESEFLVVNVETFESLEQELDLAIWEVGPLFTVTFIVLSSFAFVSLLMTDWVRGKPFIATAGLMAAMLGAASGMGFLLLCGVKFTTAIGAVPFLIIGIGMDDMYIMIAAWRCTSYTLPMAERTGLSLKHSAVSITITTMTDALAFGVGIMTPFRSVQLFCIYTMFGIIFCYFYQLSFTLACMVYDGRREHDNMHCITLRPITSKAHAHKRSLVFRLLCTGSPSTTPEETSFTETAQHVTQPCKTKLPYVNEFMGSQFAHYLMKTPVKIVVITVYGLYLGFALYGITLMKEGLDPANLIPDTSHFVKVFQSYDQYFGHNFGPLVMFVFDEPLNYTDETVRDEIKQTADRFKNDPYFRNDSYAVTSWLDYYEMYLSHTWRDINDLSEDEFIRILKTEFFDFPAFKTFISDISFDSTNTTIVTSRMFIQSKSPRDSLDEREILSRARKIATDSKLKSYTFNLAFTYYDMHAIILGTTIENLSIAVISMLAVALVFIPSFVTVVWVTLTTLSIEVGVLGYMTFCGINLDSISMINLIMCIGFSVDFAAHISYHYSVSKSHDPSECAKEALSHLGTPILQSALSTILGVAILSLSVSYIFRTFFKIVSMVMVFGSFHGLFLLPVILSTIKAFNNDRESHMTSEVDGKAIETTYVVKCRQPGTVDSKEEIEYRLEILLK